MSDRIPALGLGTAWLRKEAGKDALRAALGHGCRSFDCAKVYGNEALVGEVLKEAVDSSAVKREELYIASKVWNDDHRPDMVASACRASLARLQLSYLDLYLVHWPVHWRKGTIGCPDSGVTMAETWEAMERLVDEGLVREIGVSNFGPKKLGELLQTCRIRPVVNQVELHPQLQQPALVKFCQDNKVTVTAWSPLFKGKNQGQVSATRGTALQGVVFSLTCAASGLPSGFSLLPRHHRGQT